MSASLEKRTFPILELLPPSGSGSQPYLPSGFQGRCKIATLHAGFGVIRGGRVMSALASLMGHNVRFDADQGHNRFCIKGGATALHG